MSVQAEVTRPMTYTVAPRGYTLRRDSLDRKPFPLIGVAVGASGYQAAEILRGIGRAAREAKIAIRVESLDEDDPDVLPTVVGRLRRSGARGIVVAAAEGTAPEALAKAASEAPLVVAGCSAGGQVPAVLTDHRSGAALATRHLLNGGHRTVHFIGERARRFEIAERQQGWQSTLLSAGARVPQVEYGEGTEESGYAAAIRLLTLQPSATAVLCTSDLTALGVLRACADVGRRVPDDISVVGYDDCPEAAQASSPLSTVRQNFPAIGDLALRRLVDGRETASKSAAVHLVPAELVIRNSFRRLAR